MNTSLSTTTVRRCVAAIGVSAIVLTTFAACGSEISPPRQDIGQPRVEKPDGPGRIPERTSPNRLDFGDENGKAMLREGKALPAGSGTRNRMDFGEDNGR